MNQVNQGNWNQENEDFNQGGLNEEGKPIWNQRPREEVNWNSGNFEQTTQRTFTQLPTAAPPPTRTTLSPDIQNCVDQCGSKKIIIT